MGWSNTSVFQVVIITGTAGSGLFVYSPAPGPGRLVASIAAQGGTDVYGNAYSNGITSYSGTQTVQHLGNRIFWANAGEFAAGFIGLATVIGGIDTLQLASPQISNLYSAAVLNLVGRNTGTGLVQVPPGTAFEADAGASVTGGLTADTETLNGLLTMIASALAQTWWQANITGDTQPRVILDTTALGAIRFRMGPGNAAPDINIARSAAGALIITVASAANLVSLATADLDIATIGRGLQIAEGSNARMGVATLVAGTVTVANTTITGVTRIIYSVQSAGGTQGFLRIASRTIGTNFTITSTNAADTSTVAWVLFEPG
jgi:hypothetical protein